MNGVTVREVTCKTALNRAQGMPFDWSANPYRGCAHACTYCYARKYFARMGRDIGRGFDSEIEVRTNFAQVLRRELERRPDRSSIAFGTATDPYQAVEGKYRIMRQCLEVVRDHPVPISIVTKGTLVVRDADILAEVSRETDAQVIVSICSLDEAMLRQLEPRAPGPRQRLRAIRTIADAGVEVGVLLAPILPGLTDDAATMEGVLEATREAGATFAIPSVLKLDAQIKDWVIDRVAEHFPGAAAAWRDGYAATAWPSKDLRREVDGRVRAAVRAVPMDSRDLYRHDAAA